MPKTKICPTCGTRMNETATRCLVCGRTFGSAAEDAGKPQRSASAKTPGLNRKPRLPEVTLSLPIAAGLAILILGAGAAIVFFMLQQTGRVVDPTATATNTATATITFTPTTTYTPTMEMTATPLAPIEYTVKEGDLCASIAALFEVSIPSIVLENNLSSDCYLSPGQVLMIPQPTPTVTPFPTGTLTGSEATLAACGSYDYVVANTDTLFGIALNFGVSFIFRFVNGSHPVRPPLRPIRRLMRRRICFCLRTGLLIIPAVRPSRFSGLVWGHCWKMRPTRSISRI